MTLNLNTIRLLKQQKIVFEIHQFPDTIHNAEEVAAAVGKSPAEVYKTLVVLRERPKTKPLLIMVPANCQLDLKLVAKAVSEKKVQMATHQEAEALTHLKVGGISALALLNKGFEIYLDETARQRERILVSAGQRGVNLELAVQDLLAITRAKWITATQPNLTD